MKMQRFDSLKGFWYYNTKIIYFYSIIVKEENRDRGKFFPVYPKENA